MSKARELAGMDKMDGFASEIIFSHCTGRSAKEIHEKWIRLYQVFLTELPYRQRTALPVLG